MKNRTRRQLKTWKMGRKKQLPSMLSFLNAIAKLGIEVQRSAGLSKKNVVLAEGELVVPQMGWDDIFVGGEIISLGGELPPCSKELADAIGERIRLQCGTIPVPKYIPRNS